MVRYADDLVISANPRDVPRILKALKGRLDRFDLKLNLEKTKVVKFSRSQFAKGVQQGTFKFLGFTFFLGKSRMGSPLVKVKTAKGTFAAKLKAMTTWCKINRNRYRLAELWKSLVVKIRGHIQYYGISHNYRMVQDFIYKAKSIFFKWMNRRGQKRSFNWDKFSLYEKLNPLPRCQIVHRLF